MRTTLFCAVLLILCTSALAQPEKWLPPRDAQFGRGMLQYFMLANGYKNFNHGSFGSVPRYVYEVQQQYTMEMEARPDKWFRGDYQILVDNSRSTIAEMIGAQQSDVVLIENASSGVNAVLRSALWKHGDKVLHTNIAYPMVTNTLNWLVAREGIESVNMMIKFPTTPQTIIASTKQALAAGGFKMCAFSHVTSVPSLILPIKEMTLACHAAGAAVLIDGAHALGQVPINVTDIDADFYLANGHKWLYSPKGSAFLWVKPIDQAGLVPTVISSSGKTDYVGAFEYTGTRDYTAFCSMSAAAFFRRWIGDDRITQYNHDLAVWAGYTLARMWHTEVMTTNNATVGSMINIRMPTNDPNVAASLQQRLMTDYDTYIVVYPFQNQVWTRLSAQIFLEQQDFVDLGNLVLSLLGIKY